MREKLGSKHGIDIDDFVLHTKVNKNLIGEERYSAEHGLRTVIRVRASNGRTVQAFITLQDQTFDIWSIRSARYLD
jgi:ribosomal protein S12